MNKYPLLWVWVSCLLCACNLTEYPKAVQRVIQSDLRQAPKAAQTYAKAKYGYNIRVDSVYAVFDTVRGGGSKSFVHENCRRCYTVRTKTPQGRPFSILVDYSTRNAVCSDNLHFDEWRHKIEAYIRENYTFPNLRKIEVMRGQDLYFLGDSDTWCTRVNIFLVNADCDLETTYQPLFHQKLWKDNELNGHFDVRIFNFRNDSAFAHRANFMQPSGSIHEGALYDFRLMKGYLRYYTGTYGRHDTEDVVAVAPTKGTKIITEEEANKVQHASVRNNPEAALPTTVSGFTNTYAGMERNGQFYFLTADGKGYIFVCPHAQQSDEIGIIAWQDREKNFSFDTDQVDYTKVWARVFGAKKAARMILSRVIKTD